MFVSNEEASDLTGYAAEELSPALIMEAQTIIEAYVGRLEAEVTNASDREILKKAVAFQAVYMKGDRNRTYTSPSAQQIMQFGNMITFKANEDAAPFVAPLAVLACKHLSWKRIRSVRTGSIYDRPVGEWDWRTD